MRLGRLFNKPLGLMDSAPSAKHSATLAAVGIGASLASSLFGGIASSAAARRAKKAYEADKARENAWYTRARNENYADTAAGQSLIAKAKEMNKENWKRAQGAAAVGGGTDAATAMAKEQGNKVIASTLSDMAANDVARRDSIDRQHNANLRNQTQIEAGLEQNRANNIANAAGAASNAIMQGAMAFANNKPSAASPINKGDTSVVGASNGGTPVSSPVTDGNIIGYNGMGEPIYRNGGAV